jgi:cysteine-rich repeat protein
VFFASSAGAQTAACPVEENCEAFDLVTSADVVTLASDPTCDSTSDTVDVRITTTMASQGGSSKYDIGVYGTISADGLTCAVDLITEAQGGTKLDNDVCVDVGPSDQVVHTMDLTVPCNDLDGDNNVDPIAVWQSWAQNNSAVGDGADACTISNVIEGTTAKCFGTTVDPGVTIPFCGDGNTDAGEECDDGNNDPGDGCSAICTVEDPLCGDGNLDAGEACDDGNNQDGDGCRSDCTIEACGDGIQDSGEECDDGNDQDGDGCAADCTLEPFCGDGTVDDGEECDDGNNLNNDGCSAVCTVEDVVVVPTVRGWGLTLMALALVTLGAGVLRWRRVADHE